MNSDNNRSGKNNLFMCFRPVEIESKEEMVVLSSENPKISSLKDGGGGDRRKKKRISRSITGVFKSMLFESLMTKLSRRRENRTKLHKDREISSRFSFNGEINSIGCSSNSTVSSSSNYCCSVSDQNDYRTRFRRPVEATTAEKKYSFKIVIFLMIVCFLVLIVWGKSLAILCTSACFYLVPRCVKKSSSSPAGLSPEQRKKVIMEGLLYREHGRRTQVITFAG